MKTMMAYSAFLLTPLLAVAQANYVAHEWGTFTTLAASDGQLLSGLYVDEEKLPAGTYMVGRGWYEYSETLKGYYLNWTKLKNVKTKMETPVIYFYSDEPAAFSVTAKVNWPRGSISQWYPQRDDGEPTHDDLYQVPVERSVDFNQPYNGWIKWSASVLPRGDQTPFSLSTESAVWNAPRETSSNLVQAAGETEKYLFYRGIGNMSLPFRVEFNDKGRLVVSNNLGGHVPFVLVYEYDSTEGVRIWWMGNLNSGSRKVLDRPAWTSDESTVAMAMDRFHSAIEDQGLKQDEAKAMLKTWDASYFHTEGLKVFWVLPRTVVDQQLPLSLTPVPTSLQRVMVGRYEILTPEREAEIYHAFQEKNYSSVRDRFFYAYVDLVERMKAGSFSYTTADKDVGIPTPRNTVSFGAPVPNPAEVRITLAISSAEVSAAEILISDVHGRLILSWRLPLIAGVTLFEHDIADLASGIYIARFAVDGATETFRIVKM